MPRVASQQLELNVARINSPDPREPRVRSNPSPTLSPRLAVSPNEAAAVLGVSRDYFDEHIIYDLRIVHRGRRILVAVAELERWLDRAATRRAPQVG